LNSGVNDRRGRGFFRSMVSIVDILSGTVPLMVDVRQSGGSPTVGDHPPAVWPLLEGWLVTNHPP
jgi:hypothetical protein